MNATQQFIVMAEYFSTLGAELMNQAMETQSDGKLLDIQERVVRELAVLDEGIKLACENDDIDLDQYASLIDLRHAFHDLYIGCAHKLERIRYD